jgi:DNA invertase Pin-like site-specific DNA recombinase
MGSVTVSYASRRVRSRAASIALLESQRSQNDVTGSAMRGVCRLTMLVAREHTHMAEGRFIAYYRVSTQQQGRSGLGIEAQQAAVRDFLNGGSWRLLGEFTEVESGAHNERPQLGKALHACRLKGATLVIAKLDRLSRDAHFLLGLEKAGVDFVAADMPAANRLTVGIMAMVADEERRLIATRTKAALAAAKARGKVLGGWRGGPKVDGKLGGAAIRQRSEAFAANLEPTVEEMLGRGLSLRQMATELTAQGIRPARGGQWTAAAVRSVLLRISPERSTGCHVG